MFLKTVGPDEPFGTEHFYPAAATQGIRSFLTAVLVGVAIISTLTVAFWTLLADTEPPRLVVVAEIATPNVILEADPEYAENVTEVDLVRGTWDDVQNGDYVWYVVAASRHEDGEWQQLVISVLGIRGQDGEYYGMTQWARTFRSPIPPGAPTRASVIGVLTSDMKESVRMVQEHANTGEYTKPDDWPELPVGFGQEGRGVGPGAVQGAWS
jgi:hypothetical protein